MNLKTISLCMLGIIMMLASIWIGAWAAHEFAGTWMRSPTLMSAILAFSGGFGIVGATVSVLSLGDDNG